jgi:lysophospholipase L1-like esterase
MNPTSTALISTLLALTLAACGPTRPPPPAAATPVAHAQTATPTVGKEGQVSNAAWEQDMRDFAAKDAASPPPRDAVLFIGSSSIRMWDTIARDFPGAPVINRGFGGSEVRDSTWYADRIVTPYRPRRIVFYAGDNDLNSGRSPQQVAADVEAFIARVRRDLPEVPVVYLSIKPSPSRANLLPQIKQANMLIQRRIAGLHGVSYVDVFTPMLGPDGKPREELFREDMLHMKPNGYALWTKVLTPYIAP